MVTTFALLGPLPALAAGTAATSASASAGQAVVTADGGHRLLVGWSAAATPAERARALAATGLAVTETVTDVVDAVEVAQEYTGPAAAALRAQPGVDVVEVDRWLWTAQSEPPAAEPPTDPLFRDQWSLHNTGAPVEGTTTTAGIDVRALEAWAVTSGSDDVVVAVIDSGVNPDHPDLADALWRNPGEAGDAAVDGVDSDDNGYVDDVHGWNFVGPPEEESGDIYVSAEEDWHGTAVASLVAAQVNDVGMVGLAPDVRVMVLKTFHGEGEIGRADLADMLQAFAYAADNGADVINASWFNTNDSPLLRAAVAEAGVPVVAAAGNDRWDLSADDQVFPANYTLPNLVAVTAVAPDGSLAEFANFGRTEVDVVAPGVQMRIAMPNGWALQGGTSFATPLVSAALALARSAQPDAPVADLVDAVSWTSRPVAGADGTTIAQGMLDAGALLRGIQRPACADAEAEPFGDVDPANPHVDALRCLRAAEVATGDQDGNFLPAATINRAQLASLLARALEAAGVSFPATPADAFPDDDGTAHEDATNRLAALEIVRGDADGLFRPAEPVTRGQVAALVVRAHEAATGTATAPSRNWFTDDDRSTHADAVDAARDLGLVRGVATLRFAPENSSRRDQVASLVARLLDALARAGDTNGAAAAIAAGDTGTG
ncbi:MAG TPA: S8 family serine peptidase [Egicoccus sp.]|nr:S8 family serine peptidase [Egicoccus sp.]HSK22729.1 S8 family serine peptidase [Egicoccus sp.]